VTLVLRVTQAIRALKVSKVKLARKVNRVFKASRAFRARLANRVFRVSKVILEKTPSGTLLELIVAVLLTLWVTSLLILGKRGIG
jgi:hypothetical protein